MTWPGEVLRGERVQIRATAGSGAGRRELEIADRDGEVIGRLVLRQEEGELVIDELCITSERRGYGAGSEAVFLLLDALPDDVRRVRAWAPGHLGLAVYFWIRHGFRPLFGPGPDEGIWFERCAE